MYPSVYPANFLHQLLYHTYVLFDLSTFFFNMYFATMLYYAGYKLIETSSHQISKHIRVLKIIFLVNLVIHLALFIQSFWSNDERCICKSESRQTSGTSL